MQQWFDRQKLEAFAERVNRKLFLPMSDAQVEVAKLRVANPPLNFLSTVPRDTFEVPD